MMSNNTGVLVNGLSLPAKGHDGGFKRPFNPELLRLTDEYDDEPHTQNLILDIPVHKPPTTAFIRTHPEYQVRMGILELSETREHFLVTRAIYGQLIKEKAVSKRLLVPSITLQGIYSYGHSKLLQATDETGGMRVQRPLRKRQEKTGFVSKPTRN